MRLTKSLAVSEAAIDTVAMSATAIISTPTPDRSGDVVEPFGCRLENYARNPVVLWDHGLSGLTIPIAKSEDPDGRLTVVVTDDGIEATSYFAQDIEQAEQIFALIEQKIIRTTSINMQPIVARIRSEGNGNRPGLHISDWELLEFSWVSIPDNPECVRKILDGGKLAGRAICEPLRKSLAPFAVLPTLQWKAAPRHKDLTPAHREWYERVSPCTRAIGIAATMRDRIRKLKPAEYQDVDADSWQRHGCGINEFLQQTLDLAHAESEAIGPCPKS